MGKKKLKYIGDNMPSIEIVLFVLKKKGGGGIHEIAEVVNVFFG